MSKTCCYLNKGALESWVRFDNDNFKVMKLLNLVKLMNLVKILKLLTFFHDDHFPSTLMTLQCGVGLSEKQNIAIDQ